MMNWWILAAGVATLAAAGGHALAGPGMFYRPIQAMLADGLHRGVLAYIWHMITIHFVVSGLALVAAAMADRAGLLAWVVAAQFAGYAALSLAISLRVGDVRKLPQWTLFALVAVLAAAGGLSEPGTSP